MIYIEEMYSETEVAQMLYELTAGMCPCSFDKIGDWLPKKCEIETCPHPEEKIGCWRQYVKYVKEHKDEIQRDFQIERNA